MINAKPVARLAVASAIWTALSHAAGWLLESDAEEQDPFLDPVFRAMSLRDLADLPFATWADKKRSLSDGVAGEAEGNAGANGQSDSGPDEGCQDVQLAKRCASAP